MINFDGHLTKELDLQYANMLKSQLQLAKVVTQRPFNMLFRCPVCGDSKKNKYKTRGSIFEGDVGRTRGVLLFNCFNCNNGGEGPVPFSVFLKQNFPALWDSYYHDALKELGVGSNSRNLQIREQERAKEKVRKEKLVELPYNKLIETGMYTPCTDLEEDHPVRKYLCQTRKIPANKLNLFGFTDTWRLLTNELVPDTFSEKSLYYDNPRLVIPIMTRRGLVGMQGRALLPEDMNVRYQTIKFDKEFQKIYGMERLDGDYPVYIMEGPIDSVFVENGSAMVGGFMEPDQFPYKDRVWVVDNEPRKKDTMNRLEKYINSGEKVVLWDKLPRQLSTCKDINDMIVKGYKESDLNEYLRNNTVSGLTAKLRYIQWRKC